MSNFSFPTVFTTTLSVWKSPKFVVWERIKYISFPSIVRQFLTSYTNFSQFCFLGTTPVHAPNVWANENHKVDVHSWELNSGPYDALPRDHGHQNVILDGLCSGKRGFDVFM